MNQNISPMKPATQEELKNIQNYKLLQWNASKIEKVLKKGQRRVWFTMKKYEVTEINRKTSDGIFIMLQDVDCGNYLTWCLDLNKDLTLRKIAKRISGHTFVTWNHDIKNRVFTDGWLRLSSIYANLNYDEPFLISDVVDKYIIIFDFIHGMPQSGPCANLPLTDDDDIRTNL